ncbi:alpha/beta fold hydrolase [Raineyella fluvialis]|uniref:Alpha/beta fold hydrolase n=1 Tax=Raineyella fluvialis TaxID=2662261 RepID=A0A5Q2FHY4_9ACTN|nr:alpha/beta hydrolase [Raineyella fluvialis]QGF24275.1 alpha/beta fold hydrolase [Raineyella fluvialis]
MSRVEVNGTTLYYEGAGSGPAMLFIHGMAGFAGVWADQQARLSDAFHSVAYDRRGHTRSPKPADSPAESVELHADDAAALIRALELAPVILVGSSGGARICLDILRRYPELVRGAVLSEPPVFALSPAIGEAFMARVKPAVGQALGSDDPSSALDAFFGIIDPPFWSSAPEERKAMYRQNLPAMMADLQMPTYQLSTDDLARIDRPCLVLSGSESLSWFHDIAAIVAGAIPGARLQTLEGAGHATYATRPAEFERAVRDFARSLGDASAPTAERSGAPT